MTNTRALRKSLGSREVEETQARSVNGVRATIGSLRPKEPLKDKGF